MNGGGSLDFRFSKISSGVASSALYPLAYRAMAIWVIKDGQREGPYEEQDVRELVYEGTYTDADPAIRDGQFDWTTLGQLLTRMPPQSAPSPAPTIVPPPPMPPGSATPQPPHFPSTSPEMGASGYRPEPTPPMPVAEPPPIPAAASPAPPEFPGPADSRRPIQVAVVDFEMPFGSMVVIMVKWVLASIPALLILGAITAIFWTMFFALIAAVAHH